MRHATFCTAGFPQLLCTRGRIFYEVTLTIVGACPQIGWATAGFAPQAGDGVGDDALSWGADGAREKLWHAGATDWSIRWKDGDTIGCAADLEDGCVWFGLNGEWSRAFGDCNDKWHEGVFPAMSGSGMAFSVNEAPHFGGPTPKYHSLSIFRQPHLLHGQRDALFTCGGETALMLACARGHELCVRALIKAGADVGKQDRTGDTALTLARRFGHHQCCSILENAGATIDQPRACCLMM